VPAADQSDRVPVIVVERWRRYGHDRAYVRIDDVDAGYRDLKTGELHCTRAEFAAAITAATTHLLHDDVAKTYEGRHAASAAAPVEQPVEQPPAHAAEAPRPRPRPHPVPAQPALRPDQDLALNRPGAAARAEAVAQRQAAPVRTLAARLLGMKTDERAWRIGADAEEEVARRLAKLGPSWRVLHAIPIGDRGSDIDHLVIGPAGVFTINTKHHPDASVWVRGDTVKVNGHNQPYVRNSRYEARRAAQLLSARAGFDVEVAGLIAIMGCTSFSVKAQPADGAVTVVTRRDVASYLAGRPEVLGTPSINRIFDVARHLATWQPQTVEWQDF